MCCGRAKRDVGGFESSAREGAAETVGTCAGDGWAIGIDARLEMLKRIMDMVVARRRIVENEVTREWLQRALKVAKCLENLLYVQAESLKDYLDEETFRWRLQGATKSLREEVCRLNCFEYEDCVPPAA